MGDTAISIRAVQEQKAAWKARFAALDQIHQQRMSTGTEALARSRTLLERTNRRPAVEKLKRRRYERPS